MYDVNVMMTVLYYLSFENLHNNGTSRNNRAHRFIDVWPLQVRCSNDFDKTFLLTLQFACVLHMKNEWKSNKIRIFVIIEGESISLSPHLSLPSLFTPSLTPVFILSHLYLESCATYRRSGFDYEILMIANTSFSGARNQKNRSKVQLEHTGSTIAIIRFTIQPDWAKTQSLNYAIKTQPMVSVLSTL